MSSAQLSEKKPKFRPVPKPLSDLDWSAIRFYLGTHILAVMGVWYLWEPFTITIPLWNNDYVTLSEYSHGTVVVAIALFFYVHLSVGALAHRYYSHWSYEASKRFQYAMHPGFAAAAQGPMMYWALIHPDHHADTDGDGDRHTPYRSGNTAIGRMMGFFYSHMGWACTKHGTTNPRREVLANFLRHTEGLESATWEGKHHKKLAVCVGVVLPTVLCGLMGDLVGGFLVAACLGRVCNWHGTWIVNSVAHTVGTRSKSSSARRAWWWLRLPLGIASVGEAPYHDRHHDNTALWYLGPCDLTGWFIWITIRLGINGENPQSATVA